MFSYILYRIGQYLVLFMPLKLAYALAVFVSDAHHIFADVDRRELTANLTAIFPEKSRKEIVKIRWAVCRNFAKYLVDFFRYSVMDKEYIKKNVKIVNPQYVREALAKGKGVIVLSAHIGNWELGAVVIALLGHPFGVVALTHKHKQVNDFFNYQRQSKGVKVIPFEKAARQCFNMLKENQMVALVGDRDFTKEGGIIVDFFGLPTSLPKGPAAFALKTKAVILPVFMLRNPDDTFTLYMEKPIEPDASGDAKNENDLKELVNRYKIIIEDYVRKYPDQWYVFKKFWVKNNQ
jgi:lauroyl/myristoyl acyltransferase